MSNCSHQYVKDWIDINPERSKPIFYCRKCYFTLPEFAIYSIEYCQICYFYYPKSSPWFIVKDENDKIHKFCLLCWPR